MTIIGLSEKKGEYKGNQYHNVILYCTDVDDNSLGHITPPPLKIKFSKHSEVLGRVYKNSSDWESLLGADIIPFFDKYGNCTYVKFSEQGKAV